jgi:proteic killer suppression protein
VDILKREPDIASLYQYKSLHYEKKEGNLQDIEAVYVNMQYRLEFRSRLEGTEPDVITIISLLELSNHYKK